MIILGAGASYDSYSSFPPNKDTQDEARPPLADQLFEDRKHFNVLLHKFHECQDILPTLRASGKNYSLEAILGKRSEQAKTWLKGKQQLMAVRYYIEAAIEHCEFEWGKVHFGATNQRALLNHIERWRAHHNKEVAIVTFNYDTLIEHALEACLRYSIRTLDDYMLLEHYRLFKLHGSVSWGYITQCNLSSSDLRQAEVVTRMIIEYGSEITAGVRIYEDNIQMKASAPELLRQGRVLSPAIAIPVKSKNSFVCPKAHVDTLQQIIPGVTKVIVIGWRAQEEHFLKLLRDLPGNIAILVVAKDSDDVKQTSDSLKIHGVSGTYKTAKHGFTDLLEDEEILDRFLWT